MSRFIEPDGEVEGGAWGGGSSEDYVIPLGVAIFCVALLISALRSQYKSKKEKAIYVVVVALILALCWKFPLVATVGGAVLFLFLMITASMR